jgi:hypothetical protein
VPAQPASKLSAVSGSETAKSRIKNKAGDLVSHIALNGQSIEER